jgi:ketosteroid isomerase-like protein
MAKAGVSEADLDSIRRIYEALNRGDIDAASELLDPDVEWDIAQAASEYRSFRGREGTRRLFDSLRDSGLDYRAEPTDLTDLRDGRVLAAVSVSAGDGSPDRPSKTSEAAHVWEFRDGRPVRIEVYPSVEAALGSTAHDAPAAATAMTLLDESPYVGVVGMPDRNFPWSRSPVTSADGATLAYIRSLLGFHQRFEVLDATGAGTLCRGRPLGFRGLSYVVKTSHGEPVIALRRNRWRLATNDMTVELPDGQTLDVIAYIPTNVCDDDGRAVLDVGLAAKRQRFHVYDLEVEARLPIFSLLQVIALSECIRAFARRRTPKRDDASP